MPLNPSLIKLSGLKLRRNLLIFFTETDSGEPLVLTLACRRNVPSSSSFTVYPWPSTSGINSTSLSRSGTHHFHWRSTVCAIFWRFPLSLLVMNPLSVSYTHLRAHETRHDLVCRLLLDKKKYHHLEQWRRLKITQLYLLYTTTRNYQ